MDKFGIYVRNPESFSTEYAEWFGDPEWTSSPRAGDIWFHCGEWTGETVDRVNFNGPHPDEKCAIAIEVRTSPEVIQHLIDEHGFNGGR
jgi:hypothetical protein